MCNRVDHVIATGLLLGKGSVGRWDISGSLCHSDRAIIGERKQKVIRN